MVLHDADRIRALSDAPVIGADDLEEACPGGLFVTRGWGAVEGPWPFSTWTAVWLRDRIATRGHVASVTTIGSFVVGCAEIADVRRGTEGYHLMTRPTCGTWAEVFRGARVLTGRGRPWVILEPAVSSGRRCVGVEG